MAKSKLLWIYDEALGQIYPLPNRKKWAEYWKEWLIEAAWKRHNLRKRVDNQ